MPPELEVVAFRVLQEMLTNAIKHGRRDQPVRVERHWEGDLRIEVRNVIDTSAAETQPLAMAEPSRAAGRGSTGCAAGSSRSAAASTYAGAPRRPPTFTATAWVPVRVPRDEPTSRSGCSWSTTRTCSARACG